MKTFILNLMFVVFLCCVIAAIWYEPYRTEFGWTAFTIFVVAMFAA